VVRQRTLTLLVATGVIATALVAPAARADGVVPICPPSPVPSLTGVTTCPTSTPSPAPAPASAPTAGSTTQGTQPATASKQFALASTPELASSLLAAVNAARRAHGLRTLRLSGPLREAAYAHAQSLATAGQFTHAWPTTGRTFGSWIRTFYSAHGYRRWSAGENLLWASPGFTPANAVQQWLQSRIHRRVMLTPSWRELGVGVVSATAAPGAYGGRDVQIAAAEFGKRS
jgi:uncharacterized protein YkwD